MKIGNSANGLVKGFVKWSTGKQKGQEEQKRQKLFFAFFALLALFASTLAPMERAPWKILQNIYVEEVPLETE